MPTAQEVAAYAAEAVDGHPQLPRLYTSNVSLSTPIEHGQSQQSTPDHTSDSNTPSRWQVVQFCAETSTPVHKDGSMNDHIGRHMFSECK